MSKEKFCLLVLKELSKTKKSCRSTFGLFTFQKSKDVKRHSCYIKKVSRVVNKRYGPDSCFLFNFLRKFSKRWVDKMEEIKCPCLNSIPKSCNSKKISLIQISKVQSPLVNLEHMELQRFKSSEVRIIRIHSI